VNGIKNKNKEEFEEVSKVYTHLDKEDVKRMLKEQVYHIEDMPKEKKHALELEIAKLKKQFKDYILAGENDMEKVHRYLKQQEKSE